MRHASIRRINVARSNQTWNLSFQDLSADVLCRQNVIQRKDAMPGGKRDTGEKLSAQKPERKTKQKSKGGAWRAFCHWKFQGKKATVSDFQQAATEYQAMKAEQGERYNWFFQLGLLGKLAGRRGVKAFVKFAKPAGVSNDSIASIVSLATDSLNRLKQDLAAVRNASKKRTEDIQEQRAQFNAAAMCASTEVETDLNETVGSNVVERLGTQSDGLGPASSGEFGPLLVPVPGHPPSLKVVPPADRIAIVTLLHSRDSRDSNLGPRPRLQIVPAESNVRLIMASDIFSLSTANCKHNVSVKIGKLKTLDPRLHIPPLFSPPQPGVVV